MSEEIQSILHQIRTHTDYFQKAKLVAFLMQHHHLRIKDIANELHMKPSYLCHIIRLNKLSELIMDGYYSHLVTISHLFVVSLLKSQEDMMTLYEEILRDNLSVKATEDRVRQMLHNVSSEGEYIDTSSIEQTRESFEKKHNAKLTVIQTRIKTKLIIEWKGTRKERFKHVSTALKILSGNITE